MGFREAMAAFDVTESAAPATSATSGRKPAPKCGGRGYLEFDACVRHMGPQAVTSRKLLPTRSSLVLMTAKGRSQSPTVAQKPVDKQVAHRFAELVGLGLTQHAAAGAVGIGTRTGERLMTTEIRQLVEQTRTAGGGDPAIRALLEATDEAGNPDWLQRVKGAELALADLAGESGGRGSLLPGCVYRFPREQHPLAAPSG